MKTYNSKISLTKNDRGVYCLDPSVGCTSGMSENSRGCYNDCYSYRIAKIYGFDFSKTVLRDFESKRHRIEVIKQIMKIDMPFIRMGCNGDPSENWEHTIKICKLVQAGIIDYQLKLFMPIKNKQIVIITKHWNLLTDDQLKELATLNICVNTSVSAIDKKENLDKCLNEYERLKPYVKSILRVVSFDFNNEQCAEIQRRLFKNKNTIDTVFRSSKNNPLVTEGVINIHKTKFLGKNCYVSKYNKKTYFGKCSSCLEMCGVNI